jgi:hypothetical protein
MVAISRRLASWAMSVLVAGAVSESLAAEAPLRPAGLRCEYRAEPIGIDVPQPRLGWILEAIDPAARGLRQSAYRVLVASSRGNLDRDAGDLWDSGRVESADTAHVAYAGRPLGSGQECWWKVRAWDGAGRASGWSRPGRWTMGLLRPADWKAKWIGAAGSAFPWFRKVISLPARPGKATAYVAAMGYFELHINGKKVGDDALAPAVSDYAKRALYRTYDVSGLLRPGKNCVALWLGRGWYVSGVPGVTHDGPIVMAQVEILGPKGQATVLGTDGTWKTRPSPIVPLGKPSRLGPQCYDGTKEVPDWNTVALDDSGWAQAAEVPSPPVVVSAQACEPNRVIEVVRPVAVDGAPVGFEPGTCLIDMGRLLTGWFEMRLSGPRGTRIHAEFVENRAPDGKITTYNQVEEFVLRGGGEETIRTRFNYHAYRWVALKGIPSQFALGSIRGLAITTDMPRAAEFKCSNALLNRIYETTLWTYRCLSLGGYTVDCPHRERLGYGGDAHATMETAMTSFAAGAFYTKWLADWRDAQDPKTGDLPHVAPPVIFAGGGPAWSGICVTLPWQMYRYYGDTRILEQMYPTIQRWLAFLETKTDGGLLRCYGHKEWAFLGDWVPPGRGQEPGQRVDDRSTLFFNNCYYLYNLELAAKIAQVLGKTDDARKIIERAYALAQAIHKEFYQAKDATYANGEQPYLALALLTRVAPEDLRAAVLKSLERAILVTDKGHINAGIHGHYFLIKSLLAENRNDWIFTMVNQTTYPGWGNMLQQGATTIWEQWDGQNSHCHSSFLGVGLWFLQGPAGIRIDDKAPGFRHVVIRPAVVGDLRFLDAHCDTIRGRIGSSWKIDGDRLRLFVTIPPNTSASVWVPAKESGAVTESDRPADQAPGVKFVGMNDGAAVYEVGSGRYAFVSAGFGKR